MNEQELDKFVSEVQNRSIVIGFVTGFGGGIILGLIAGAMLI